MAYFFLVSEVVACACLIVLDLYFRAVSSGTMPTSKNAKVIQHLILQARDVIKAVRLFIEEERK